MRNPMQTCLRGKNGRCYRLQSRKRQVCRQCSAAAVSEKLAFAKRDLVNVNGVPIAPMGFGCWAWGNRFLWNYSVDMDSELQQVFNLVVSNGINLFDTADSYGTGDLNGKSEQLLGRFVKEYPGSERFRGTIQIATKFAAYPWRILPANMVAACKGSLRRLGCDQIGIGQLHWSAANYAILQEYAMWAGLADCYDQGLVAAVGVSNFGPKQLRKVQRYMQKRDVPLATAQIQFSLLSQGRIQTELKELCDEQGIVVIAYSPLALGLLTGKYSVDSLPKGPRGVLFKGLLPKIQPLLDALRAVAKSRRKTMSQVAINWCICKGTVPIPGAKDLAQARENLGALGWRLSAGEVAALDAAAARLDAAMVQNIFQTS